MRSNPCEAQRRRLAFALITVRQRAEDLLRRGEITHDDFAYLFDGAPPRERPVSLNLVVRQPNGLLGYYDPANAWFAQLNLSDDGMLHHLLGLGFTEREASDMIREADTDLLGSEGPTPHTLNRWIGAIVEIAKHKPETLGLMLLATVPPHRADPLPPIVPLAAGMTVWLECELGGPYPVLTTGVIRQWDQASDTGQVDIGRIPDLTGVTRRHIRGVVLDPEAETVVALATTAVRRSGPTPTPPAAGPPITPEEIAAELDPEYLTALRRAESRPTPPALGSGQPRRRRSIRRPNGVR